MALKAIVSDINEVPEAVRSEYTKTDEGYVLNVDNADYQQKIGEFRTNNIRYKKERDDLAAKAKQFEGIDPAEYSEMRKKIQELDDKNLLDAGKIDELVEKKANAKTDKMKAEYDSQIKALKTSNDETTQQNAQYKSELDRRVISDIMTKEALKIGNLHSGALDDILARASRVWKVNENGVPVAMKGDEKIYGKDGKELLTFSEWMGDLSQSAGHFWQGNSGGGAPGSEGGSFRGGVRMVSPDEGMKYHDELKSGKAKLLIP